MRRSHSSLFWLVLFQFLKCCSGQNLVQHPSIPVELGETARLTEISHNYFVIFHQDAKTVEQTPRVKATELFAQEVRDAKAKQQAKLKAHYLVQEQYFPWRSRLSKGSYTYFEPEDFKVGLIMNPCKGNAYNCCNMRYGMAEYRVNKTMAGSPDRIVADETINAEYSLLVDEHNITIERDSSRLGDDAVAVNNSCIKAGDPHPSCMKDDRHLQFPTLPSRKSITRTKTTPPCWDNNYTVVSGVNCSDPDTGVGKFTCVQVGFTSNALIPVCAGEFADDAHCGTYLEVHLTETSQQQSKGVNIYEHHVVMNVQCGTVAVGTATCEERLQPGTRFEVRRGTSPSSLIEFGPVTVERTVEMNKDDVPCDRSRLDEDTGELEVCASIWVYWKEELSGPGYENCASFYDSDQERYEDTDRLDARRCNMPDSITPAHVRGGYNCPPGALEDCATLFTVAGNERVLSETKIKTALVDGYNTTMVSTLFGEADEALVEGGKKKILCNRQYELWWVTRTKGAFVVLKRKRFRVVSPECRFDSVNNKYFGYALLEDVPDMAELQHVVHDQFRSNDRAWYLPGDMRRTINAAGKNVTGLPFDQFADNREDYFFDH
jgi:hypothetical protein